MGGCPHCYFLSFPASQGGGHGRPQFTDEEAEEAERLMGLLQDVSLAHLGALLRSLTQKDWLKAEERLSWV